jgi:hypothetical protein
VPHPAADASEADAGRRSTRSFANDQYELIGDITGEGGDRTWVEVDEHGLTVMLFNW